MDWLEPLVSELKKKTGFTNPYITTDQHRYSSRKNKNWEKENMNQETRKGALDRIGETDKNTRQISRGKRNDNSKLINYIYIYMNTYRCRRL